MRGWYLLKLGEMAFILSSDGEKSGILAFWTQFTTKRSCGLQSSFGLTCSFFTYFISGVLVWHGLGHFSLGSRDSGSIFVWCRNIHGIGRCPWVARSEVFPTFDRKANTDCLLFSQQRFKINCEFPHGVEDAYSPSWHGTRHFAQLHCRHVDIKGRLLRCYFILTLKRIKDTS